MSETSGHIRRAFKLEYQSYVDQLQESASSMKFLQFVDLKQ